VLRHRRGGLMLAALTVALVQAGLIVVAPYNIVLLNRALGAVSMLSFLALPALFWPAIRRVKQGHMRIVSRRLATRARRAAAAARLYGGERVVGYHEPEFAEAMVSRA